MQNSNLFRLILDPPRSAAMNMAVDEFLMGSQERPESEPVLRFYSWERPSITIGYFQDAESIEKKWRCRERNIPLVRRPTGGGLVQHGNDLTFSLALKCPSVFLPGDVKSSYLNINGVLIEGLKEIFKPLDFADCKTLTRPRGQGELICFESPSCYDLMLDGKKVGGSSQRRRSGAMLHQAALFLSADREAMIQKIVGAFGRQWGIKFNEIPLRAEELELAEKIRGECYERPETGPPALPPSLADSFF